jgi:hypothetical protein
VIWSVIMDSTDNGLANSLLRRAGFGSSAFLADPNLALYCVMWVMVWGSVGFYLVLFNAAMSASRGTSSRRPSSTAPPAVDLLRITCAAVGHHPDRLGVPGDPGARRLCPGGGDDRGPRRPDNSTR